DRMAYVHHVPGRVRVRCDEWRYDLERRAAVLAALRAGAGDLLESIRLFDVYADDARLGAGVKSLAFALSFRAPDRTLTQAEADAARDAALARAADQLGARLRG
ncbi:MAG: hypothetical protein JO147_07605, partial [Actinobacteria bacterium]|nr:hypothetical protein [Actinomycetota bacterium]